MIEAALCAAGGVEYLTRQAEQNPVAFLGLVGRVMPMQLAATDIDGDHWSLHLVAARNVAIELRTERETLAIEGTAHEVADETKDAPDLNAPALE